MTRRKRIVLALVGGLVVLAILVGVAGVFAAGPIVRSMVERAARERGVELEAKHVDLGWGWVRLREANVVLQGVPGLRAEIGRATVDIEGLQPSRVEVRGLAVQMEGSAADFVVHLGAWAKRHPRTVQFPIVAEGVSVTWAGAPGQPPWLDLGGGMVAPRKGGSRLTADHATVLGLPVGPVGAVWASDDLSVTFGFGNPDPAAALARMDVDRDTSRARLSLRPLDLASLAQPLGVPLPIDGTVVLEGHADLDLKGVGEGEAIGGELHAELRGYVPPHPKELNGIVFGDVTKLDSAFRLSSDRRRLKLTDTRVAAGAFVLTGSGSIDRMQDHARIEMDLKGDIPCTALAKSAAAAHLGGPWGRLLGNAAGSALAGAVRVGVTLRADSRRLDDAKVKHKVEIGCRLRFP